MKSKINHFNSGRNMLSANQPITKLGKLDNVSTNLEIEDDLRAAAFEILKLQNL